MDIVFFGTTDFGVPALERLIQFYRIAAVVSTPSRPRGRGLRLAESPVVEFAKRNGLSPVFTPQELGSREFLAELALIKADLFVVIAFRMLPESVFSMPPLGTLNVHASLLPKYRGPAPIQRAVEAGETETGVTVFKIDRGIDRGGVLLQKRLSVGPAETSVDLFRRLSICGASLLTEAIEGLAGGTLHPVPQDESLASRAPKLAKEEARIRWNQPAPVIGNRIRAFKPFPGTYALLNGKRLGIERAAPTTGDDAAGPAGSVIAVGDSFFDITCSPGVLRVFEVKPEGRKKMDVHDFLLGTRISEGTQFT